MLGTPTTKSISKNRTDLKINTMREATVQLIEDIEPISAK